MRSRRPLNKNEDRPIERVAIELLPDKRNEAVVLFAEVYGCRARRSQAVRKGSACRAQHGDDPGQQARIEASLDNHAHTTPKLNRYLPSFDVLHDVDRH